MNDLVKFGGGSLPANTEELAKGLQNVGQNLQGGTGGVPFMRLMKTGVWVYGPESIEVEEGSTWAVNPYSLQHGFICWGDGELLGEQMVAFNQPPPAVGTLPDYGQKWDQQVSLQMQCMDGEDTGVNALLKGSSLGLRNAVKKLIDYMISQSQHDPDHIVPVMELDVDSYKHKKYGEIFYPVLEPVKWISIETGDKDSENDEPEPDSSQSPENSSAPAGVETSAPAEKSTRRRRGQKAETKPAEADAKPEANESPQPTSRRRRRG